MTVLTNFLLGLIVLFMGRRLFWILVAVAGFIAGIALATTFFSEQPDLVILGVALLGGVVGAIFATVLQELAIAVAGFIFGAYAAITLTELFAPTIDPQIGWVIAVVVGVVAAFLVIQAFDIALIGLSSFVGATLITDAVSPNSPFDFVLLVVLITVGIVVQGNLLHRTPKEQRTYPPNYEKRRRK